MLYPRVNENAHIAEINNLIKKLIRNRLWSKRQRLRNVSESKNTYRKPSMEQIQTKPHMYKSDSMSLVWLSDQLTCPSVYITEKDIVIEFLLAGLRRCTD